MAAEYLVGHDVGTGGCKSVLVDIEGNMASSRFLDYPVSYPGSNLAEQDPRRWWEAVASNTRSMMEETRADPARVTGVGFSGQMIGLVPVDRAGNLLRDAIIWLDSRADRQAARLVRRLGGRRLVMKVAGAVPSGKDVVCKIAWLRENEPDTYRETHVFLDVTGYLVFRSTGNMVIDHTGAAGTGLLSNRSREWSRALARLTGVPLSKMPELKRSVDIAGPLTGQAADQMGLNRGTPVIAGMADIPAAATGSGALEDGDAHIYLGTSSWLCLSVSRPRNIPENGIVSLASPDPSMFIMLGESETAGACLEWFAGNFATPGERDRAGDPGRIFAVMDEEAERVEPGSDKLIFLPWLFGERAPVTDTTLRGGFVNLRLGHTREHLLRAVYEGVAYNLRWMMDAVEASGFSFGSVRAIGGGAGSDLWMRIISDVSGRRVEAVEDPREAGAKGCALAAAVALGVYGRYADIKRVVRVRKTFQPVKENAEAYGELYRQYRGLYRRMSRLGRELNEPA